MASHRTVLLVQSEPPLLDSLGFALRRRGYHVITATDGSHSHDLLARHNPDAVVVGMLLAGTSGFRVAQVVKESSDGRVPVVMTARTAAAHRDYALALGVDRFVAGPFAAWDVASAVEALCPLPVSARLPGSGTVPWPTATPA